MTLPFRIHRRAAPVALAVAAVLGAQAAQAATWVYVANADSQDVSVLELDRKVGEAIDIFVNNRLIARGEVVVVDDRLGVTMTEIIKTEDSGG